MKDKEIRMVTSSLEIRAGAKGKMIVGYAAKFNSMSEDLGGFREQIIPGAFSRAIKQSQDVRALLNHDPNYVLGRTKSGTLTLKEDLNGLEMSCMLPDTTYGRDLAESINRGDIDQQSFSFRCITDKWNMIDGVNVRSLLDLDLYDVSPVTFPAYTDTSVGLRSMEAFKKTILVVSPVALRKARLRLAKNKK